MLPEQFANIIIFFQYDSSVRTKKINYLSYAKKTIMTTYNMKGSERHADQLS